MVAYLFCYLQHCLFINHVKICSHPVHPALCLHINLNIYVWVRFLVCVYASTTHAQTCNVHKRTLHTRERTHPPQPHITTPRPLPPNKHPHTNKHTHIYMHARMHKHAHACTCAHAHERMQAHAHTPLMHTCIEERALSRMCRDLSTRMHKQTHTCTPTGAFTHTFTHAHAQNRIIIN